MSQPRGAQGLAKGVRWPRPPAPRVVIVGGGLAGMAAAVGLNGHGLELTLLESRPRLGGRASSFPDQQAGGWVDACQHVSMVCCTNLADFCAKVGLGGQFQRLDSVRFIGPGLLQSRFQSVPLLPAPLHLGWSFVTARFLSLREKLQAVRGVLGLGRGFSPDEGESFGQWLRRHGQSDAVIRRFWDPILVSALNDPADAVDCHHARKVFLDGFARHRDACRIEIPRQPMGVLFSDHMTEWLNGQGIGVELKTGVSQVEVDCDGGVAGVRLRDGRLIGADFVVLAVPWERAGDLLPGEVREGMPALGSLGQFKSSPITAIHLWFDRDVCPVAHAALLERRCQWVFNRTALLGERLRDQGQYLQVVISSSHELVGWTNIQVRDMVLAELAAIWPEIQAQRLAHWRVVTEHAATIAVRPSIDQARPGPVTATDGLYLAGDWTSTGWPSTMEGAVRSGYKAAEAVLANLGVPRTLLRPDLHPGWLARLIFGRADAGRPIRPAVREVARRT